MDYALQKRLLRYLALGVAEDELDWTTHDNRYHGGHFDPKTMTCKARRAADEGDLADVLTAEREEADYKKMSQKLEKERVKRETAERIERKTIAELTSRDYTDEDREMVDAALRHVMTAKPVEVTMQEANKLMRELIARNASDIKRNMAKYFSDTYSDGLFVSGIGRVEVNKNSAKSLMAHTKGGFALSKFAVLRVLSDILAQGVLFSVNNRWKDRSYDSFNFATPMTLDGEEKIVEITIIRYPMGKQELYNIKVIPKKIVGERAPHDIATRATGEKINSSTTPHSLPNNSLPVNGGLEENLKPPKLPSSNLVRQYLAANGLLSQYLPKQPVATQDATLTFDAQGFLSFLKGTQENDVNSLHFHSPNQKRMRFSIILSN